MAFKVEKKTYNCSSVLSMLMTASSTGKAVDSETREQQESLTAEQRVGRRVPGSAPAFYTTAQCHEVRVCGINSSLDHQFLALKALGSNGL